jgi:Xaa-Pro dipeptidase
MTITPGQLILIDAGGYLYGYASDITRTFPFGTVSDELRTAWDLVKQAQLAALAIIQPGLPCGDADDAARQVIVNGGYGPGYKYFVHRQNKYSCFFLMFLRLGHGIGLQGHEEPYLVQGNNVTLQSGNTFSVEPGIYVPNEFGIRLEDIVLCTATGYEVFGVLSQSIDDPFGGN